MYGILFLGSEGIIAAVIIVVLLLVVAAVVTIVIVVVLLRSVHENLYLNIMSIILDDREMLHLKGKLIDLLSNDKGTLHTIQPAQFTSHI